MKKIWKFEAPIQSEIISHPMAVGAQVLTVQVQGDVPMLWALIDPDATIQFRRFRWYGTGYELPDDPGAYVGTIQMGGGDLILHLFETTGVPA